EDFVFNAVHANEDDPIAYWNSTAAGQQRAIDFLADKDKVTRQWFAPILAGASDAVKEEVFASVAKTPAEAFASALSGLLSFDTVSAVEAYHGPGLAIAAAPVESPASLHKQVETLAVVKMDGVSHWLMLDKPEEFNRILDQFLKEIADSR
ncbi:MAG: hypothetical protein ACXW3E_07900, partial [Thermoanaerobaculia bacterium]